MDRKPITESSNQKKASKRAQSGSGDLVSESSHSSLSRTKLLRDNGALPCEPLERAASAVVQKLLAEKELTTDEVAYIAKVDLSPTRNVSSLSFLELERLRRMCQLWDIQLRPTAITSHRPIIGPCIVGLKKILFSIVGVLLKDVIRQQRDFNGAAIAAVTALSSQLSQLENKSAPNSASSSAKNECYSSCRDPKTQKT